MAEMIVDEQQWPDAPMEEVKAQEGEALKTGTKIDLEF
jgi:hypothetical protein